MVIRIFSGIFLILFIIWQLQKQAGNKIVFCDVGQGSATLIQFHDTQLLIDTGPSRAILACLGKNIPVFDRRIEYVVISHDARDHEGGLLYIAQHYSIDTLISQTPASVHAQKSIINRQSIRILTPFADMQVRKASDTEPRNTNNSAYVTTLRTHNETVFISSDISGIQVGRLIPTGTSIFTVPHHGSRHGLYPSSLSLAHPSLAVISVGKNNGYGHPDVTILKLLKSKNIRIWRTDVQGELVLPL